MFEAEALRALLFSTLAGLATLLGALIVFVTKKQSTKLLVCSLGFASGVMLSASFMDLLPAAIEYTTTGSTDKAGVLWAVLFLAVGVLLAAGLDRLAPSGHHDDSDEQEGRQHKLYRIGFVSMLAIALHNFPEGIATFMAGVKDVTLGASIALAIALHNIPEGVSVAMPIYFATGRKGLAFKYTLVTGIAEPIGALLAFLVLRPFITDWLLGAMFALVAGIMIYICVEELIPTSRQYGHDRLALVATFAGLCLMPLTHLF